MCPYQCVECMCATYEFGSFYTAPGNILPISLPHYTYLQCPCSLLATEPRPVPSRNKPEGNITGFTLLSHRFDGMQMCHCVLF